jgi:regulatory protein
MKIIKIIKLKGSKYKVIFDNNNELILYEDIIVKYVLFPNKVIDDKLLVKIKLENEEAKIYDKCLRYITTKLRSEKEIKTYLEGQINNKIIIIKTINRLKKEGQINDYQFATAYLNDRWQFSNAGLAKIKKELFDHGIDEDIIMKVSLSITEEMIMEKIIKLVTKQIKLNSKYSGNILKRRILNYMYNLGFEQVFVLKYLDTLNFKNTQNLEKEFKRLYDLYAKKYTDDILKLKIKQKLYQKGYDDTDINDLWP